MKMISLTICTLLALLIFLCHRTAADEVKRNGVLITDYLRDGELERRVKFKKWMAKETSSVHIEDGERVGALLWQVTDGEKFIQLIYNGDRILQDCEYLKDRQVVSDFLEKFEYDKSLLENVNNETSMNHVVNVSGYRNVTMEPLSTTDDLPLEIREIVNYRKLRQDCKALHKEMRAIFQKQKNGTTEEKRDAETELVRSRSRRAVLMPGSVWCGTGHRAHRYADLGLHTGTDRCCRDHDHCSYVIPAYGERYGFKNKGAFTMSFCNCDERRRREIGDIFRVPHTVWCGKGNKAKKRSDLGALGGVDQCCRHHDTGCPFSIQSFSEKYGLYNHRIYTMMHCSCDDRFRSCLKQVNTGASNLVGNLFFNIIQTKCFLLKPQKVCAKQSWWGKCLKYEVKKKAIVRESLSY